MDGDPTLAFYQDVLETLTQADIPFLVGGAYALSYYTAVVRPTKDLDLFIRRHDAERIGETLRHAGYTMETPYPHWLAKVRANGDLVDLIFSSGNGIAEVDDAWLEHAPKAAVLGVPVLICPVEETIWSKAFIMERERYDGADIVHLLRACSDRIDWHRLLRRFSFHWRVLLSHLTLFGFVYPAHRNMIPSWLMVELLDRLRQEALAQPTGQPICAGTLLSREQYLVDVEEQGYRDARIHPLGNMSEGETAIWTEAISRKQ
ncbi:nucleotidyltransferase [Noviherbaspirillum saxi]|nr:nucleotidyltransferase [Noviherbaspirillum saxi]